MKTTVKQIEISGIIHFLFYDKTMYSGVNHVVQPESK